MNDAIIEVELDDKNIDEEEEDSDKVDSMKETPSSNYGSNRKNKGKGKSFNNSNNKKGDNKQNNNKNENNSKEQNNGDKSFGGFVKAANNTVKKSFGNTGEKSDQNLVKQLSSLVDGLLRNSRNYPLDSPVLFLLYRCIVLILAKVCLIVWYNLYFRDTIVCVSSFNADFKIEDFILNICLSYPYIGDVEKNPRYLLYYRWLPYVHAHLLIIAYIPRLITKWYNNSRLQHLLQDLTNASQWYDSSHYKKLEEKLFKYFEENLGTHPHLYLVLVLNHLLAASISVSFYVILDYLLQGRFCTLPFDTIPITRDPTNFTDVLSKTFPPFVNCYIAPPLNMKNMRAETLHCHLTLMEFYEKFFYIFWFLLFGYMVLAFLSVIMLMTLWMPFLNRFYLKTANKSKAFAMKSNYLVKELCIWDIYSLYLVKKRTSVSQFTGLINHIYDVVKNEENGLYNEKKSKLDWSFPNRTSDNLLHLRNPR